MSGVGDLNFDDARLVGTVRSFDGRTEVSVYSYIDEQFDQAVTTAATYEAILAARVEIEGIAMMSRAP